MYLTHTCPLWPELCVHVLHMSAEESAKINVWDASDSHLHLSKALGDDADQLDWVPLGCEQTGVTHVGGQCPTRSADVHRWPAGRGGGGEGGGEAEIMVRCSVLCEKLQCCCACTWTQGNKALIDRSCTCVRLLPSCNIHLLPLQAAS